MSVAEGTDNVRGYKKGGRGDRSPPVGSRGEAPVGGLGDFVPQKLEHFCATVVKLLHDFSFIVLIANKLLHYSPTPYAKLCMLGLLIFTLECNNYQQ